MRVNEKTPSSVKNIGQNAIYDFVMESTDFNGMETAYESLPYAYRRSQAGSGYCLLSGGRDHHFIVRGIDRARHIVNHYRRLLRKRKRGGFKVYQYVDEKDDWDCSDGNLIVRTDD